MVLEELSVRSWVTSGGVILNLTPLIPLSFKGEGEEFFKRDYRPS
jgi:hypothetical protein